MRLFVRAGQQLKPSRPLRHGLEQLEPFHRTIDDKTVRAQADAMVSTGMRDAGYIYVNIDDTWQDERDAQGNIQTNSKFPDMKALADYVHSKGLKIGIYSSPGRRPVRATRAASGTKNRMRKTYAAWGFDYLKYDCAAGTKIKACRTPDGSAQDDGDAYIKMHDALLSTGRPIVYQPVPIRQ